jgi:thiol:disulfide interchange protein DsbD
VTRAVAVALVAIAATACGAGCAAGAASGRTSVDVGGAPDAPPRQLAPRTGAEPAARAGAIAWTFDEPGARARSRHADRPLLVFVTAGWCLPCKTIDDEVFSSARIVRAARGAVALRLDVTDVDDPATLPLMERLDARGVPLVVVLGPDGRERFRAEALPIDVDALERALTD